MRGAEPRTMLPTGTVPMLPVSGPAGIGTLIGLLALGALAALLVGFVLHRREQKRAITVELSVDGTNAPASDARPATRLSA